MGVRQYGLWSSDDDEVKAFVDRVTEFNKWNLMTPIKLDILPYKEGDQDNPNPHYKLNIEFPSQDVKERFWLG